MLLECRPPNCGVADMNALASFVAAAMARESAKECGMRFANGMAGSLECLSNLVHPVNPVQTPGAV